MRLGHGSIDAVDVTVHYGRVVALDRVSLSLHRGVTALLGPNGAGKTTLLSALVGMCGLTAGSIAIAGRDLQDMRRRRSSRGQIGYLPQRFDLASNMRVSDVVRYAAWCNGVRNSETTPAAAQALALVELTAKSRARVRTISGGERQRLGLAAAVAHDPTVLLLDEPTVGLDPEQRVAFREYLTTIAAERTIVLATHLLEDVALAADRVVVLTAGRVAFDGSTDELSMEGQRRQQPGDGGHAWESDLERGYRRVLHKSRSGDAQ